VRILIPLLLLVVCGLAFAVPPDYGPHCWIYSSGSRIDCGYYGSPEVADWDLDGNKDLILGIFTSGNIWFYTNEDGNDSPVFNGYEVLYSDGSPISVPSG
jgi:hypothetical protein